LVRINPRAMREKEKKIGATFINLADYVNPDPIGVNTEVSDKENNSRKINK
jgi:hypothetical protein